MRLRNELYIIAPIMSVVFLVIIGNIAYSILGTGTLVFWVKNYNQPCTSNNTSTCRDSNFTFNEISVDNKNVSGGGIVHGGQIWRMTLNLDTGVHSMRVTIYKVVYRNGFVSWSSPDGNVTGTATWSKENIHINVDKKTCVLLPLGGNANIYENLSSCPK